ncbi:MAG: OmpA family protein [Alphaproteobacteria bacterium]
MKNLSTFNRASMLSVAILLTIATNNQETSSTEIESDALINNQNTSGSHMQEQAKKDIAPPPLAIFFGPDEDEVPEGAEKQIKDIAQYLIKTGDTFEIEGCTSKDGQSNENFFLATRRAQNVLTALEEQGVPVTRYQNIKGVVGQDRDIYGTNEGECASLVDGVEDNKEESRRANIHLNPDYTTEEPKSTSNQGNIFDLFKSWSEDTPEI